MRQFADIGAFLRFMNDVPAKVERAAHVGLEHASLIIEAEAKREIGTYQEAAGPFQAWEPLSSATMDGFEHPLAGHIPGKTELGYAPPDNPLLREGFLRESIGHLVQGFEAVVGSNDPVAVWQEMGTPDALYPIPPRSFLGGAAVRKTSEAVHAAAGAVVAAIAGLPPKAATRAD